MTRRQRIQVAKAHFLADAAEEVVAVADTYQDTADALGVSLLDVQSAAVEVRRQLLAWAYRITPPTVDP